MNDQNQKLASLAEVMVISAVLLGGQPVLDACADHIDSGDFLDERCRFAWIGAKSCVAQDIPILGVYIAKSMPGDYDANVAWICEVDANAASTVGAEHYAKTIAAASRQRKAIKAMQAGIQRLGDAELVRDGVDDAMDAVMDELLGMFEAGGQSPKPVDAYVEARKLSRRMNEAHAAMVSGASLHRYPATGLKDFDPIIGGWKPGNLYVVGAQSGHGKTNFCAMAAYAAAAKCNAVVLYATMEIPGDTLVGRMLTGIARVETAKIDDGNIDDNDITRIVESVKGIPKGRLWILDTPPTTIAALERNVRRVFSGAPADVPRIVVVDYAQLMRSTLGPKVNREQQVAEIADGLLAIAKRHKCAVIAAAQLNREFAKRADKRPVTSDLRESDRLVQNAHCVMFVYRPEAYGEQVSETECELIVRKHRGPKGTAKVYHNPKTNEWRDLAREYQR